MSLDVLAELAIGGHGCLGVLPEDEISGVAGDGVGGYDGSAKCGGEGASGVELILDGGLVGSGLGCGGDGCPECDAEDVAVGLWPNRSGGFLGGH